MLEKYREYHDGCDYYLNEIHVDYLNKELIRYIVCQYNLGKNILELNYQPCFHTYKISISDKLILIGKYAIAKIEEDKAIFDVDFINTQRFFLKVRFQEIINSIKYKYKDFIFIRESKEDKDIIKEELFIKLNYLEDYKFKVEISCEDVLIFCYYQQKFVSLVIKHLQEYA